MAGPSATLDISPADLSTLQNVPKTIATLATTVTTTLESIRSGTDSGNPVSAALGGFGALAEQAEKLPSIEKFIGPLKDISAKLPAGKLGDLTAIGSEVEKLLALFGPLKDAVASGDVEKGLKDAIAKALDHFGTMFKPGDEVTKMFGELEGALGLFRTLLEWQTRAPRPEELVDMIARGIGGVPVNLLAAPAAALETALAPLATLLPTGNDLSIWRGAAALRVQRWQAIEARISASANIDWAALEIDVRAEVSALIDARAARDRLFSLTLANIAKVNLSGLAQVGTSLISLPRVTELPFMSTLTGLRRQLQTTAEDIEAWAPTEDEIRRLVRGLLDKLVAYVEESPLGQIRTLLIDFQQRLLLAIEDLPFRALAAEAEALLRSVAKSIEVVDPNFIRQPVHEFFNSIENKLDAIAGNAVSDALAEVWNGVENTVDEITGEIEKLTDTLQGLVAQLQGFATNIQPTLDAIIQAVGVIRATLDEFDLTDAAAIVIDKLHELRDTVAELDLSALPDSALSALHSGAQTLRAINIAEAINPPLSDALAEVDPTKLIKLAMSEIAKITDKLKLLDPATLVKELDKPVDLLLEGFTKLGPDQFRKLIDAALDPVEHALRSLEFTELFAPITKLFAELTAKVDAVLNPDLIFDPLDKLFKPVEDVVDGMLPSRFLGILSSHGDGFASGIGTAGGSPPGAITGAGLKAAIPANPEMNDDLFGFRIGDLLIPLIDIHRKFSDAFDRLDDQVLSVAAQTLRSSLSGRLEALSPVNVSLRISGSVSAVHAELNPAHISVRLHGAMEAYYAAVARIGTAANSNLSADDTQIAQRTLTLLGQANPLLLLPTGAQFKAIFDATVHLETRVDLNSLRSNLPLLALTNKLIPDFLKTADVGAATIRQALRDLDPAPLRIEINEIFDRIGRRIVGLKDIFFAALEELGKMVEEFLLPISPGNLVSLADRLHAGLKDQLFAFHPRQFKDEVQLIFDTVKRQLGAFNPTFIVQELNELRDVLIQKLRELVGKMLPDPKLFDDMQARIALLKPSVLLSPLVDSLVPVSQIVAGLDPNQLLQPLVEAIARVREQLPEVIAEVEAALDELLDAFPDGGPSGAGGSVGVG